MPIFPHAGRAATLVAAALTAALLSGPAAAEPSAAELDRRINQASRELEVVVEQYNDLREDMRATQRQATALDAKMAPLEQQLAARRHQVGALAANTYRSSSGLRPMAAALNSESAQGFLDYLLVLDRLSRDQRQAIAGLNSSRLRFDAARTAAQRLADRQRTQQQRLTAKKKQVEAELSRLVRLRDGRTVQVATDPRAVGHRLPDLPPGAAATAVKFAYAQLGKPYGWGAAGPRAYDCSGLTSAAWAAAGIRLPHSSQRQWTSVTRVSRPELQPGDLIFYYGDLHHVGMYVGAGMMIHAPQEGQSVRLNAVNFQPVYGYGRPG
ncbi:Cell wall-associated hydrolase, NlpC family [Micromonospora pattaloongensis]|uniref:Cell wall-associated hydrolase, NlpC family n=1 Tax=Micromonospora pattaloongensis TaxID=405436 RepID=A0A1H3MRQ1_9ACTN|nr:C40 family peptidase [Micromonospora pattaloongensis]SDY79286.1 Cell wall-associated hydrolase, NlpC family [Micromonospora pattaloongensis]